MKMYKRIRELREDSDLNQSELAKILNVSRSTYSRYESGFLDVTGETLVALAKFYGDSVDCILELED